MIRSIIISGYASYQGDPVVIQGLKQRNYLYGTNGSGKSTIARVLDDDPTVPASCSIEWDGEPIKRMVYNREFVRRNFGSQLKGVFTLGEKDTAAVARIAEAQREVSECVAALANQRKAEEAKSDETDELTEKFTDACWVVEKKYDEVFADALTGTRTIKVKFRERVLDERSNTASLREVDDLKSDAKTLFGTEPVKADKVPTLDFSVMLESQHDSILQSKIVGKEDVDVAALIRKLESDDWVSEGRDFLDRTDGLCPFCQKPLPPRLEESLNKYFDESYLRQKSELALLVQRYEVAAEEITRVVDEIVRDTSPHLDIVEFEKSRTTALAQIEANRGLLKEKVKEPSGVVTLRPLDDTASKLSLLITTANAAIEKHNKMVEDYKGNKARLIREVWKFLVEEELKATISDYLSANKTLLTTLAAIRTRIKETEDKKKTLLEEIAELSKKNTSIVPTKNYINKLLRNLGFGGFYLEVVADNGEERGYILRRTDGTLVEDTLSEGEQSFVSFLYFYSLLKGSHENDAATEDLVVVVDDPVSSLDSEILFIVSTLIRRLCVEAGKGTGHIRQVICLTHNTYFHKEVTFRSGKMKGGEAFWLVRKPEKISLVDWCDETNPVQTSYKFMWEEVQRNSQNARVIQNTMRRILEHYFKNLGGMEMDGLLDEFPEADQITCHSLLAWVNDGSHSAEEDMFVCTDGCADTYLRVFRDIFEKSNHISHYLMMCSPEMTTKYELDKEAEAARLAEESKDEDAA